MKSIILKSAAIAASSVLLLAAAPASAGPDAVRAKAYFNAISGGDAETIASFYADDAEFHWIGGPLAGVYNGKDKIKAVWEKFSKAAGALDHDVLQLSESANGKLSTVTARVKFKGQGEVPVKFIMTMKDGKIASEVWQVDKAGAAEAKADAKTAVRAPAPAAGPVAASANAVSPASRIAARQATDAAPSEPELAAAQPQRGPANASAQRPVSPDAEAISPEDDFLPDEAETPDANPADVSEAPPVPTKKAEATPDKDIEPAPKLAEPNGVEPKSKAIAEKKPSGYDKPDFRDEPRFKKKRFHDYEYYGGYGGHRGYGWGGYGSGYGHRGGYGHGY